MVANDLDVDEAAQVELLRSKHRHLDGLVLCWLDNYEIELLRWRSSSRSDVAGWVFESHVTSHAHTT